MDKVINMCNEPGVSADKIVFAISAYIAENGKVPKSVLVTEKQMSGIIKSANSVAPKSKKVTDRQLSINGIPLIEVPTTGPAVRVNRQVVPPDIA